jgi:uncharacterized protein (TIGR03083 family)
MPLHPAAPSDTPGLLAAYDQSMRALVDLGSTLREEEWGLPTDCPGWSVKDVLAHVAGLEGWLAGDDVPQVEVPDRPHVANDVDRFIEGFVEVRRPRSGAEVVEELAGILTRRQAQLYGEVQDLDTVIVGAFGPAPAEQVLGTRILDVWTHEQDVRHAIGRPGNLDTAGAAVAVHRFELGLPRAVARTAGIEPGQAVVLDVTGPLVGRMGVRVEDGADGRPRGVALFSGESSDVEVETTTITLSTDAFARRASGRGTTDDVAWTVTTGSEEIARRVMDALPMTP